jgi:2,3-bisphosphoglycerate-dependent phosphoglycerate mutase
MYKLVLLRHGESQWNLDNRFTGWTDVGLTKKGESEAYKAGRLIKDNNISFDTVHTSVLKRANRTMGICLDAMGIKNPEINYDWRLNERHYGALQGLNKSETALKYGDDQVLIWRRSYSTPPPKLDSNDERHPKFDSLYKNLDENDLPDSECLADTVDRFLPYWHNQIKEDILNNKKVLIVAHGNSLRALVKYLNNVSDENILKYNIPTGAPLVFELEKNLKPIRDYYLGDQDLIAKKMASVKNQGKAK